MSVLITINNEIICLTNNKYRYINFNNDSDTMLK